MTKQVHHIPIRISGLSDGIHEFDRDVLPAEIGLPEEFTQPIAVRVHMDKTHSQIIMKVSIATSASFPCDRCLDPVVLPIREECLLFYARDMAYAKNMAEDDVRTIDPGEPIIDIGDDVKDMAVLGTPMKRTCGEDERGNPLCKSPILPGFIAEDNEPIDPRWEKLRNMRTN